LPWSLGHADPRTHPAALASLSAHIRGRHATLKRTLPGRSRRSLFRDLQRLDYLASYSHAGRYYALRNKVPFDPEGLWIYQGIGFSVRGTLRTTVAHLVDVSDAGRTHRQLELRLRVRAHNVLLDLVHAGRVAREDVGPTYLYVSADLKRAKAQIENRLRILNAKDPTHGRLADALVVEVLLEIIHGAKRPPSSATNLTRRLMARGVNVTAEQVKGILDEHGIGKKGQHSRSRSSRR